MAAGYAAGAVRFPFAIAVIDELGALTFADVHRRTNSLADGLAGAGVDERTVAAVLCRNHRGFIEATVALGKLGAQLVYLNTGFAGPQLADVVVREGVTLLVYDEEFDHLLAGARSVVTRFVAWHDGDTPQRTLDELIASGDERDRPPPARPGRTIILTSGTTGTPKGARQQPRSLGPAVSLMSRIPLHARETTVIAAPLFHSWGFAHFGLGLLLGSTLVLQRRFDPEATLAAIASTRATALVVVPVMLQRILDLPEERCRTHDTSSLRTVPVSGAALPGDLATRFMDEFGDVLYNLYGSTEVAWATIATPTDMRAAPGTAGRPPRGTVVKVLDANGHELPTGGSGRIFVGNEMLFEGYTTGGSKEVVADLMSTGDVGWWDHDGRLFVEGRDDEMIVSGGENVFPREVEDLLAGHDAVQEVAVVGVPDEEFGQRLKAVVVRRPGFTLTDDQVRAHVRANLARYKVPREVEFIDSLPRNQTGKVLKKQL
jgi:fatty-acyl-CoA synthase